MKTSALTFLLIVATSFAALAETENWPQYRGAKSDGLGEGATLPESWSATENVVWKAKIPGWGWSSPIVWGERIFVTSAVGETELPTPHVGGYPGGHLPSKEVHKWTTFCLDFDTGKVIWERVAQEGVPDRQRHPRNSFASETPVTDGERVYAYFGHVGVLACYGLDGAELWKRSWRSYPIRDSWGTGTSPVVHNGRVFIQNDNEEESWLEALDAKTGETLWRVPREERSNWSTPYIWVTGERTELVTIGTGRIRSYDLDGAQLWELRGTSGLVSLTPMAKHGLLYIGAGYHYGPLYAIHPGATGDISLASGETSNEWIAWSQRRGSSIHPCYLISDDRLFVCYDSGLFACFNAKTGEEIFPRQRLETRGGRFYASPWAYNGKVFLLNENGDTWVVEDGPEYKLIRKNSLGDVAWATPAIARGSLFIRTYGGLFRIQNLEAKQ